MSLFKFDVRCSTTYRARSYTCPSERIRHGGGRPRTAPPRCRPAQRVTPGLIPTLHDVRGGYGATVIRSGEHLDLAGALTLVGVGRLDLPSGERPSRGIGWCLPKVDGKTRGNGERAAHFGAGPPIRLASELVVETHRSPGRPTRRGDGNLEDHLRIRRYHVPDVEEALAFCLPRLAVAREVIEWPAVVGDLLPHILARDDAQLPLES